MTPPVLDDQADAGRWSFILTYHRPSFLRVEPFEQPDEQCPNGNCLSSGAVDHSFHNGDNSDA